MQGIMSENIRVKAPAMHVETVLPERSGLSTSTLTDDGQFVLECIDSFTVNDVLRQTIVDVHHAEQGSPVERMVSSAFIQVGVSCLECQAAGEGFIGKKSKREGWHCCNTTFWRKPKILMCLRKTVGAKL